MQAFWDTRSRTTRGAACFVSSIRLRVAVLATLLFTHATNLSALPPSEKNDSVLFSRGESIYSAIDLGKVDKFLKQDQINPDLARQIIELEKSYQENAREPRHTVKEKAKRDLGLKKVALYGQLGIAPAMLKISNNQVKQYQRWWIDFWKRTDQFAATHRAEPGKPGPFRLPGIENNGSFTKSLVHNFTPLLSSLQEPLYSCLQQIIPEAHAASSQRCGLCEYGEPNYIGEGNFYFSFITCFNDLDDAIALGIRSDWEFYKKLDGPNDSQQIVMWKREGRQYCPPNESLGPLVQGELHKRVVVQYDPKGNIVESREEQKVYCAPIFNQDGTIDKSGEPYHALYDNKYQLLKDYTGKWTEPLSWPCD